MKSKKNRFFLAAIIGMLLIAAGFARIEMVSQAKTAQNTKLTFVKSTKKLTVGNKKNFKVNLSGAKWTSSKPEIAYVSKKGVVKAKRYGKTRITATCGKQSVSLVLQVKGKKVIGIDAGHQSKANLGTEPVGPGSSTKKTKVSGGTSGVVTKKPEYKLTLEIAKKLKEELEVRGYQVVMTRTKHDIDISNKERAQLLNKNCDIALRLHADGATASANGASALYPTEKNPYVGNLSKASKKLSEAVLDAYVKETRLKNRGLSPRDDLTGTNWSTIPVTLIEMGFMTNTADDKYMSSAKGQKAMVEGMANGIDAYFGY